MLIRREQDGVIAIGQLSHAWLSGQLARGWGNARFPAPEPREETILGAQQHDIGWALFDLQPPFNADSGLPRSFLELTVEEQLQIWRTAPERLASQSLYAALVVSLHGRSLSELRLASAPQQAAALQEHIALERERQAQLCAALGVSEQQAQRTQRQMWTWDGLSLALCLRWQPFTAREVPAHEGLADIELLERGEGRATLDPWPFTAERVQVRCEGRRLQAGYESESAMRRALERAVPVTLTFTLLSP